MARARWHKCPECGRRTQWDSCVRCHNIGGEPGRTGRRNALPTGRIALPVASRRSIGDIRYMYGEDGIPYVAFRGGEGGRNWSINSTSGA